MGRKGSLVLNMLAPNLVLRWVGNVAYELYFPSSISSIHPVFHMSMLRKCMGDPSLVIPLENIGTDFLSYKEVPIRILDRQFHQLRTKEVA